MIARARGVVGSGAACILWALVAAGLLLMVGDRDAQAAGRPCYECHKDAREAYNKKIVHDPVKKEDCESCHKRHGFEQKLTLQKDFPQLCTDCHGDVVATPGAVSQHLEIEGVSCASCHDSHASDVKGLMRGASTAEACAACHTKIGAALKAEKQHPPFAEGNCAACHAPHDAPAAEAASRPREGDLRPLPRSSDGAAGTPCST